MNSYLNSYMNHPFGSYSQQQQQGSFNYAAYEQSMLMNALVYPSISKPKPMPKIEGGVVTKETRYAIRSEEYQRAFVTKFDADAGFTRDGTLETALLFNTADAAAQAIAARNGVNGIWMSKYAILPVTITDTTAKVEIIETTSPEKTVFRIRETESGKFVRYIAKTQAFQWGCITPDSVTDFQTANDAASAIRLRNEHQRALDSFVIVPVVVSGVKRTEQKLVAPATTVRSL